MRKTCFFMAALMLGACVSTNHPGGVWTAVGYLSPPATDAPDDVSGIDTDNIIGEYETEAACRDAVETWMSRQVVGNPVSGECLATERN